MDGSGRNLFKVDTIKHLPKVTEEMKESFSHDT
jgi:hypothetical protein